MISRGSVRSSLPRRRCGTRPQEGVCAAAVEGSGVPELTVPWDDPDHEREVLVSLLLPQAQSALDFAVHRWSSLEAKTFGLLAIVAAVIGGLAAAHDAIHPEWWAPAAGCAVAAAFFIRTIWPRDILIGPDVVDFHDEARALTKLEAARALVESLTDATENIEEGYDDKTRSFQAGLAILLVSLIAALPVVILGP
jgi:hypothetical protein